MLPASLFVTKRMRPRVFHTTLALLCMFSSLGSGQSSPESGLEGVITISPTLPGPIKADTPTSVPLPNTTFIVENETGTTASFTTDDSGRFRISLKPGHYRVSKKGQKPAIGHFGPFDADVVASKMTKVEWECDAGTR